MCGRIFLFVNLHLTGNKIDQHVPTNTPSLITDLQSLQVCVAQQQQFTKQRWFVRWWSKSCQGKEEKGSVKEGQVSSARKCGKQDNMNTKAALDQRLSPLSACLYHHHHHRHCGTVTLLSQTPRGDLRRKQPSRQRPHQGFFFFVSQVPIVQRAMNATTASL